MIILPAILTKTSDEALTQLEKLRGVAEWIQIDVMDDTFVPGYTFDLYDIVGELNDFHIEVHLMVENPQQYFEACHAIDARRVYFHIEAAESPRDVLHAMGEYGFEKGLAIAPRTSMDALEPYLNDVQAVQVMTIEPGAQGRVLMPEMLTRVQELRTQHPDLWLSVDGGVNEQTVEAVADVSTDAAGVGSAISKADDPVAAFEELQGMVER